MRVQGNVVARSERVLLNWICERLPGWVTPDLLTGIGMLGALVVCLSYIGTNYDPVWLWAASLGLVIHWFGDSLDGSLARSRGIERPRYGYFVDHSIDAICNSLMMLGLGATVFVRMDIALFALNGYLLLSIFVFLKHKVSGVMQLSFMAFGPTEVRMMLIAMNAIIYFSGPVPAPVTSLPLTIYDLMVATTGFAFFAMFLLNVFRFSRELAQQEPAPRTVGADLADMPVEAMELS